MVFSDLFFIFVFLPAFLLCSLIAYGFDRQRIKKGTESPMLLRNVVLVLFSLLFYAWGEPMYVFLMLGSVVVNYFAGLGIERFKNRKAALTVGLVCNLLILGTFKYAGFFAENLNAIGIPVAVPHIALPIGISFYTFQSISYLVDVYRRQAPVQRRIGDLLLYISMFPQLIAGPIVRYDSVAKQIKERHVTREDFAEGAYRFFIGLGKKVILANQLSEISDQFLVDGFKDLSTAGSWLGITAFTFQIFFDFSGYSDMAIGLGRCMGFRFAENFKHPYCSKSISEFWRRWHISLGSFFRDYVYIPMGGNRSHQALNIFVVWFLTGMWHGASWNFIIWGLYFGVIVTIEKYTLMRVKDRIPAVFLHIYSLVLLVIGWGIFYFDKTDQMLQFFRTAFGGGATFYDFTVGSALTDNFWLWVVCIVMCMPVYDFVSGRFAKLTAGHLTLQRNVALITRVAVSVILLLLSVSLLVGATNNAFIYTRF